MSIKLLSLFHAFGESDSKILGSVEIINSQLIGTGACLPDFVLTNAMLEHMVDTKRWENRKECRVELLQLLQKHRIK